ncbi:MAG: hypothetical protein J2P26_09210, partial [Nocardiopsaceae bacterium]|nr:hypothetical protein [Nocardiopsaceae bacterium]
RRAGWRSIRVAGQVLLSVAMIIVAACWPNPPAPAAKSAGSSGPGSPVGHTAPAHTPAAPSDTPAPASPVPASPAAATPAIQKTGYVLRPSSFFDTNTQDKVDLDTGCPGWGDMHPHVGPSRCGGLADLVVEDDSLHTADSRPDIVALPPGATANESSCRSLLSATPNDAVYSIPATSLRNREVLCVRTDIGNTAVVHIRKVVTDGAGQLAAVTIDFKMWTEN